MLCWNIRKRSDRMRMRFINDASLLACRVYEKRGYVTLKYERHPVENKAVLVYEIMQKQLGGRIGAAVRTERIKDK